MMEPKNEMLQADRVEIDHSGIVINPDLMNDAVDGENREHQEGLWASVKSHPWACLWAFIMCFTIVSLHSTQYPHPLVFNPMRFLDLGWRRLALCVQDNS